MLIVQTPLRLSFMGGGTDFEDFYAKYGGNVLSAAIDKYVYVIIKKRFDSHICLNYSQRESTTDINQIRHDLIREALRITGVTFGVEITTLADVPSEGTGLGSSSSIMVSLLHALYIFQGISKTNHSLAEEACQIEIEVLGRPIGKQDQYIAAYGDLRFISFNQSGITLEKVDLSARNRMKLQNSLVLFYTGVSRDSRDILSEQKSNINNHIIELNELKKLTLEAKEAVIQGEYNEFGNILHKGWELKKKLASKVTNSEIDEIYKAGRNAGALGGKICGAGGGGFILFYCPQEKQENLRHSIKLKQLPFIFERDGSKVIFDCRRPDQ